MKLQQAESEERPRAPDPFQLLHLLPTAPQELVVEVYWHLVQRLQQGALETPELRSELDGLNDAYARILRPYQESIAERLDEQRNEGRGAPPTRKSWLPFRSSERSQRRQTPWGLLHLDPGAPLDVVDLAYLFWRLRLRSQWQGPAATKLNEIQGAYEALRQEQSGPVADGAATDSSPALNPAAPEAMTDVKERVEVDAAGDLGDDVAGAEAGDAGEKVASDAEEEPLREIEVASPQGRGMPLIGPLGRWAKRRFGKKELTEPLSEPANELSGAAPPPSLKEQEESWPLALGVEELDEVPDAPEEAMPGLAGAGVLDEIEPAIGPADSGRLDEPPDASPEAIPPEYRLGGQADHALAEVQSVAESSDALAYLVADGGSVRDVRAVIGSQPFAIGSDRSCGLKVGGLGTNGGAIAARIWAHDERFMLHVLAKEPAVLVNGEAMVWAVLEDGDRLQFGDDAFRFERAATQGRR